MAGITDLFGPIQRNPVVGYPGTYGATAVAASNLIVKATSGILYCFDVSADATLAGAAWWIMIFDAATLPANGTVTPAKVYAVASGVNQAGGTFGLGGVNFTTGIVIGVSTTGPFSLTASAHAFIGADYL